MAVLDKGSAWAEPKDVYVGAIVGVNSEISAYDCIDVSQIRSVIGAGNRHGHPSGGLRTVAVFDGVGDRVGCRLARGQPLEGGRRVRIVRDPCPRRTGKRHCCARAGRRCHDF